ncbi:hypothetical protein [Oricola nitratireducens]|uniref:hypothetical protein n=1 Tax=Oricola nitratireducens TaxID=2775868 RepID=UPI0018663685|nr:hypothetical protein [Oricola nitratireducens]
MFGKRQAAFGRRQGTGSGQGAAVPPHPGPDPDGVRRVIPKEVWDGPQGEFLREIGVTPDDPSNVIPGSNQLQARHDRLYEDEKRFIAKVNSQLPHEVSPWAMIPWPVWQGQHGDFLLKTLETFPIGPWNTMLLPVTEKGALVYDLPKHPMSVDPSQAAAAERLIGEIRAEVVRAHEETGRRLEAGDTGSLGEFHDKVEKAKADVRGLAFFIGSKVFGDKVWQRHMDLFGATLGWIKPS